jgi:hypothetical protein
MKVFKILSILSCLAATTAKSEVVLTPRLSHSYNAIKFKTDYHVQEEPYASPSERTLYSNTQHVELELAYTSDRQIDWFMALGYSFIRELEAHNRSADLGTRAHFNNFYTQFALGFQQILMQSDNDPFVTYSLATASLGVGYTLPVSDIINFDIFYRGVLNIHASAPELSAEYTSGIAQTRIMKTENHQLGLGVSFAM